MVPSFFVFVFDIFFVKVNCDLIGRTVPLLKPPQSPHCYLGEVDHTKISPPPLATRPARSYRANWANQTLLFSKPLDLAQVCHRNKICSKASLTWKLTLVLAFQHIAYRIKSWMEFLGPILAKLHKMPPASAPSPSGARRTPCWARGGNVQWGMKAWSGNRRRHDLPMCMLCVICMRENNDSYVHV